MALWDHIKELKNRLIKSAIAVVIGASAGFLYDPVADGNLSAPLISIAHDTGRTAVLNFSSIASPFDFKLQLSLLIGAVISSPVWIYQLWAFITPGLTKKERRLHAGLHGGGCSAVPGRCGWPGWCSPQVVRALTPVHASERVQPHQCPRLPDVRDADAPHPWGFLPGSCDPCRHQHGTDHPRQDHPQGVAHHRLPGVCAGCTGGPAPTHFPCSCWPVPSSRCSSPPSASAFSTTGAGISGAQRRR